MLVPPLPLLPLALLYPSPSCIFFSALGVYIYLLPCTDLVALLGGRKKALCCTPNLEEFTPASCDHSLCKLDSSYRCGQDTWEDNYSDEYQCDPEDCTLDDDGTESRPVSGPADHDDPDTRSKNRQFESEWTVGGILYIILTQARRYAGSTHLHSPTTGSPASNNAFR